MISSEPDLWHPIKGIERAKREAWKRRQMKFENCWNYIVERSKKWPIPVVQDRTELEYVFNLMKDCKSYLEVGSAEGNSLYVLTNAMPKGSEVTYIDWAEKHTEAPRNEILEQLKDYKVRAIHEDSNDYSARKLATVTKSEDGEVWHRYDAVLIDAGHEDINVAIDAIFYGDLANKYIIFHDIKIPDVERVFNWYCYQRPNCKSYRIINSDNYGFGIIEVK